MPDIKFSQLPDLPNPTPSTIIPVVEGGQNFTVTANTLQGFVNSTTGNVTAGNLVTTGQVSATGNISGNFILGNGSQLTGLPATYGNANVTTLLAGFGSNAVSTTGNVTAGFLVGDGSQITNLPAGNYSNANVTTLLAGFGSNAISTTGNVTAGYFLGDGSQLTNLPAGNYSNANVAAYLLTSTGNIGSGFVSGNTVPTNISTKNLNAQTITTTGVATLDSVRINTFVGTSANGTLMSATTGFTTSQAVSAAGNVTGAYIKGNGSALTGVVTSIVAGSGISINQATGAVTVTATGGGSGNAVGKIASSVTIGAYGSTTETLSASVLIPAGTFTTNDTLEIFSQWINNVSSGVQRYANIYVNTTNAIPSTSTQIWGGIVGPTAYGFTKNWLRLEIVNGTNNTRSFFAAGAAQTINNTTVTALGTGVGGINGGYTIPINWGVDQYIIFTGRNVNAAGSDSIASAGYQIYKG